MSLYIVFIILLASSLAAPLCKPTETEQTRAAEIAKRIRLVETGEIEKQIGEKTYTAESLLADMLTWWVNAGLLDQSNSIQKITTLLKASEPQTKAAPVLPHIIEWTMALLKASSTPGFEDIGEAVVCINKFALSLSNTAKVAVAQNENYFDAIQAFRKSLPLEAVDKFALAEEFTQYLTGNATRIFAGYRFLTLIMECMPSYRQNINGYVSNFLTATFPDRPAEGDSRNSVVLKLDVPVKPITEVIFPMTPGNIDACVFIQALWDINEECIDKEHLNLKWLLTAHSDKADVYYNCDQMRDPVVCCGFFCEQCDNPHGWPTPTMRQQCLLAITELSLLQGQVYGSGVESCFGK